MVLWECWVMFSILLIKLRKSLISLEALDTLLYDFSGKKKWYYEYELKCFDIYDREKGEKFYTIWLKI